MTVPDTTTDGMKSTAVPARTAVVKELKIKQPPGSPPSTRRDLSQEGKVVRPKRKLFARKELVLLVGVALFIGLFLPRNLAAQITFNTALPVAEGNGILRGQYVLFSATRDPTSLDRSVTVHAAPFVLAAGATRNLALFLIVPYMHNSLSMNTPMGRITQTVSGIGDSQLMARYTVYQLDRKGSTIRVAPFGGVKFPTGRHDESDSFGPIPRTLQLGSGSWDGLGGAAFTYQTLAWEFDADGGYRWNTEADGFRFGDESFADGAFKYRVWPLKLAATGVPHYVYAVLESNLMHQQRNEITGSPDPNSGGTTWTIDPGLQYVTANYILEAVAKIPTTQRLYGTTLRSDFQFQVGFRWNFTFTFKF